MDPSEIIKQFLDFLDDANKKYDSAGHIVNGEDKKVQDFLHDIEFCNRCEERSKITTKLHISRGMRREAKDTQLRYEKIVKFYRDPTGKAFVKSLKRLVQEQEEKEKYINGERHYNKRGSDER